MKGLFLYYVRLGLLLSLLTLTAAAQCNPKTDALADGDSALNKMSGGLLMARKDLIAGASAADAMATHVKHAMRNGKLQVILGVDAITSDVLDACGASNLDIIGTYEQPGGGIHNVVVQCSNPRQLESLAHRMDVRGIAPEPVRRRHAGSVSDQADLSIHASSARSTFGVDGTGVRVGVLSDSIHDIEGGTISSGILTGATDQSSGDLPSQVRVIDAGPGGGADEGAGMAEIVHDLAPGAAISFASAYTSYAAFATNITSLATDPGKQCKVICDDVAYFAEPVYQNGPIAIACNSAYSSGAAYFSAAGNEADDAHERAYFDVNSGSSSTAFPPTGVDFHDFGQAYGTASKTHLAVSMANGDVLTSILHWDEPYAGTLGAGNGSQADLDLYVVSNTNLPLKTTGGTKNVLTDSIDAQGTVGSPSGEPYEIVQYQNTGTSKTVYLVIDHYQGRTSVNLHLLIILDGSGGIVDKSVATDRTIVGHPAAENAIACAATWYKEIDTLGAQFSPSNQYNVDYYSSRGGNLPFWFSDNGLTRYGSAQTRFKPEITAPDGVDTSFFPVGGSDPDGSGHVNFFGTSAAAPHAAGVAALILARNPSYTPAQVYSKMKTTAVDIETAGVDNKSGYGLIDALASVPVGLSAFSAE